jgi:rieske iron-sulfur protein
MSSNIAKTPQVIVFFGFVALAIVIIIVSIGFLQPQNKLQTKEAIILPDGTKANINDFPINHAELFMYPSSYEFGQSENAYQTFSLIRLPEELGGDKDDISSFRAYSVISLESHCMAKYWPQEGRKRIEDPCHNGVYRIQDGLQIGIEYRGDHLFNALPYLELSTDEQGYIYAEPPTWTLEKNGVIGIGRKVSEDLYRKTAISELNDYLAKSGKPLDIPLQLKDGSILTPGATNHDFVYKNTRDIRIWHNLELTYCNCNAPKNTGYVTLQEKWKLGDDLLYMNKVVWDNDVRYFDVIFFKNGYQIRFMTWSGSFEKVMTTFLDNFYENKNYSMLKKA